MPLIVTVVSMTALIIFLIVMSAIRNPSGRGEVVEDEGYEILLYKSTGGSIEFDRELLKEERSQEILLSAKADQMVTFLIDPAEGKTFNGLTINDSSDINRQISYLVNEAQDDKKRINFVMPDTNVIINLSFDKDEQPAPEEKPVEELAEAETEGSLLPFEQESPYGLTLHGLTAPILASYGGEFDDVQFLKSLGDQLLLSSPKSPYRYVTDVTFSEEEYEGEKEDGKVYHLIYFNEDPTWKALATYFTSDKAYVFSEVTDEAEAESEDNGAAANGSNGQNSAGSAGSVSSSSGGNAGTVMQTPGTTTTTSFDIMEVSTVFLGFVGGEENFYEQTFQYVLLKGLTGQIVGTMSGYELKPEKDKASFSIALSTGGTIKGTYDKAKDTFSYSGL